jgi:predicted phosphate transport protein (TIGR00153 family)
MLSLSPKEGKFYDLFISFAKIIYKSSEQLRDFVYNLDGSDSKYKGIKDVEHEGDKKLHEILEQLNKTFLTPFDREDIYTISKQMDDIIDMVDTTASRFVMFNIQEAPEEARKISDMIVNSSKEIIRLMEELKIMKKSKALPERIIEINRIEEEGDVVFRKAFL